MVLEGMEEEREATLNESQYGFYIYILNGYTFKDTNEGKSYIAMDYDPDFKAFIDVLDDGTNIEKQKKNMEKWLEQFGKLHDRDPKEHFDPYYRDAYFFLMASEANKGSVMVMLKEVDDKLVQYTVHMPLKEAAEGAGPSLWTMLKTIKFLE